MNVWRARFRETWRGLRQSWVRSTLMGFTFALGFASILIVIGGIEGGRRSIEASLNSLGVDVIAVINPSIPGLDAIGIHAAVDHARSLIDTQTVRDVRAKLGDRVKRVLPVRFELTLLTRGHARSALIFATEPGFDEVVGSGMLAGRFLNEDDRCEAGQPVNVVLDEAVARMFEPEQPERLIGETLKARRGLEPLAAHVVGILNDPIILRKHLDTFDSLDKSRTIEARRLEFRNVYVPIDLTIDKPTSMLVQVHDPDDVGDIGEEVSELLAARKIKAYFHVQKTWIEQVVAIVNRFSFFLNFLWVVNLIVVLVLAGTIAMLAVEERYSEIAIRRVEGARVVDIVAPLIGEGMALAILAIPFGWIIAHLTLEYYMLPILEWEAAYPPFAIYGTPLLLIATGVGAYVLPARRVARMEPVQALGDYSL